MVPFRRYRAVLMLSLAVASMGVAQAQEPVKVVYHISEGVQQASRAIGNIRNHLRADATTRIVVVSHGPGIEFLLDGAEDAQGRPFSGSVGELASRGVQFQVCNNTLNTRRLTADDVVLEAKVISSGVEAVARLQAREGYAYLKP